jgi:hypothetical protein
MVAEEDLLAGVQPDEDASVRWTKEIQSGGKWFCDCSQG